MPFPERLLRPGEEVLVDTRPRLVRLLRPTLFVVSVLAASIVAVLVWVSAPIWFGWVLIGAIALAFVDLAVRAAQWRAESLTVTTRRVVYRAGILRRLGREIPIANVQSVSYRQGLVQRALRTGDLLVESAGEASREPFPDVPDPEWVQTQISAAMERSSAAPYALPQPYASGPYESGRPYESGPYASGRYESGRPYESRRPYAPDPAPAISGDSEGWSATTMRLAPDTDPTPIVERPAPGGSGLGRGPGVGGGSGGADVVAQIERLAALYERGVLTRGEFESKKAELLARL